MMMQVPSILTLVNHNTLHPVEKIIIPIYAKQKESESIIEIHVHVHAVLTQCTRAEGDAFDN